MRGEYGIDYYMYKMDFLCDLEGYGYLVFYIVKGKNLNHFDVYLETNEKRLRPDENNEVYIGEELPLWQLKKLYQFIGLVLNLKTEESEVSNGHSYDC